MFVSILVSSVIYTMKYPAPSYMWASNYVHQKKKRTPVLALILMAMGAIHFIYVGVIIIVIVILVHHYCTNHIIHPKWVGYTIEWSCSEVLEKG